MPKRCNVVTSQTPVVSMTTRLIGLFENLVKKMSINIDKLIRTLSSPD